ncbi:MAG: hypothetical protein HY334_00945 [Armatimonadetes bacterium]|nr:hypothetical protein [Armatimonadota bacterium]
MAIDVDDVLGPVVRVRLRLAGARIIPQTTFDLKSDEGHVHLKVDGAIVSMTFGLEQEVGVTACSHLLEAECVISLLKSKAPGRR